MRWVLTVGCAVLVFGTCLAWFAFLWCVSHWADDATTFLESD